ncbi:hypothetical protein, variant 2 [Cladophialophora immunda]|uniref:Uncharacterized protein n=1 Tax=Cladophialophora immunda TaxID=569365 RepID=A0A0D2C7P9_9EURO|nr:hypothetical protein, variant 2 [Cladophialophora immunda]KIW27178.1 hypothetical protein, variant 2 [Cladophialophora immunda]
MEPSIPFASRKKEWEKKIPKSLHFHLILSTPSSLSIMATCLESDIPSSSNCPKYPQSSDYLPSSPCPGTPVADMDKRGPRVGGLQKPWSLPAGRFLTRGFISADDRKKLSLVTPPRKDAMGLQLATAIYHGLGIY